MVANKGWALLAALVTVVGSGPARAACWSDQEIAASRVRELQAMLMVATLRCHAAGVDIVPQYDGFVSAERDILDAANMEIKRHFAVAGGQAAYDAFATLLANSYGSASSSPADCAEAAHIAVAAAASPAEVLHMSALHVFPRALPEGSCAEPKSSFAAIVAASARTVEPSAAAKPEAVVTELALNGATVLALGDQPRAADRPLVALPAPQPEARPQVLETDGAGAAPALP